MCTKENIISFPPTNATNDNTNLSSTSLAFIERYGGSKNLKYVKVDDKSDAVSKLTHLFLNDKRLHQIKEGDLAECSHLKVLYLHDNAIKKIENLLNLTDLTHLYLQRNRICKIDHLNGLTNLQKLYLGGNSISKLENLDGLPNLEELHVERQQPIGDNLDEWKFEFDRKTTTALSKSLKVINITGLRMTDLIGLHSLSGLEELIAAENRFANPVEIGLHLLCFPKLRKVSFEGCPAQKDHRYVNLIAVHAHQIDIIDDKEIPRSTRDFFQSFYQIKKERAKNLLESASVPRTVPVKKNKMQYLRATQSLPPPKPKKYISDFLQDTEELTHQTWNSILPKCGVKKTQRKSAADLQKIQQADVPVRGRLMNGRPSATTTRIPVRISRANK